MFQLLPHGGLTFHHLCQTAESKTMGGAFLEQHIPSHRQPRSTIRSITSIDLSHLIELVFPSNLTYPISQLVIKVGQYVWWFSTSDLSCSNLNFFENSVAWLVPSWNSHQLSHFQQIALSSYVFRILRRLCGRLVWENFFCLLMTRSVKCFSKPHVVLYFILRNVFCHCKKNHFQFPTVTFTISQIIFAKPFLVPEFGHSRPRYYWPKNNNRIFYIILWLW